MNKQQLVDAVGERLGDRKTAATAVEAVLDTVSGALADGERVSLFGFGVFEKVDRAARTARNPSTGATVQVAATSVPRFRPGQALKDAVNGRASRSAGRRTSDAAGEKAATAKAESAPAAKAKGKAKDTSAENKATSKTKGASETKAKSETKGKAKSGDKGKAKKSK
jgi:DNA-binding protein HU-beta